MGIFEIIILIAATLIFIILVRRFPDTAEDASPEAHTRIRKPYIKVDQMTKPLQSFSGLFNRGSKPPVQTNAPLPTPSEPKQFEPGASPQELERFSPTLRQTLSEAGKHFEAEEYRDAERLYLKAASEDPKCTLAYNRLGLIYLKRKETLDDAEDAFRQAYKFDPTNGFILDNLGLVNYAKGLFNEAVGFYERSINSDASIAERHAHLGLAFLSLRHYAKAVRHLARAWALEPANDEYKQLLDDAKDRERRLRTSRR